METREASDALQVDLDDDGEVGFDLDHAFRHLDLSTLETEPSLLRSTKVG